MTTEQKLIETLALAEDALGGNLQWISDQADLSLRQGNAEAMRRLQDMTNAWRQIVAVLHQYKTGG